MLFLVLVIVCAMVQSVSQSVVWLFSLSVSLAKKGTLYSGLYGKALPERSVHVYFIIQRSHGMRKGR